MENVLNVKLNACGDLNEFSIRSGNHQRNHPKLSYAERHQGYVRPLRDVYTHLICTQDTRMPPAVAETFARNPNHYAGTYCAHCAANRPLAEFVWKDSQEYVGS